MLKKKNARILILTQGRRQRCVQTVGKAVPLFCVNKIYVITLCICIECPGHQLLRTSSELFQCCHFTVIMCNGSFVLFSLNKMFQLQITTQ
jgi:hypothetical protein